MMDGIYQSWQNGVMWACLGMLGVMAVGIILYGFGLAWGKVREWWSLPLIERVLAGVFVVGFAYYGSTKHGAPSVRWDDGLADNGTLITNDTVSVRWTYPGIPSASSVFIDYREAGSTNKWLNLAETLASAQEWTGTLGNATNYDYWVYSTYVPPVPVHTNGVWVGQAYETKARVGAKSFLILNGKVQEHGRTIATPAAKRRDLPYDSEVAYLESTGTQFINTGIYPSSDMSFVFTAALASKVTGTSYSPAFFGGRINTSGGNGIPSWWNSENFWFYGWGNSNDTGGRIIMQFVVNRAYTFYIDRYGIIIDGVEKSTLRNHTSIGSTHSIYLFNLNNNGTPDTRIAPFRIYNFAIYQNGVLVRDFIPVRVGTTGALYDKRGVGGMNPDGTARNDGLYFNRGTGDFGYGNDK